jgi:uncharacterized protein YndB with AHSA1/START domain
MTTFEEHIIIDAPVATIWTVLADIGTISVWNPGVEASHSTNETLGLGGTRHCDLKGSSFLKEEVVKFELEKAITMRITDSNMPFKYADIRFTLTSDGHQTSVTVSPEYELKYGIIGTLMDKLMVYNMYKKGMGALLKGLKRHAESVPQ